MRGNSTTANDEESSGLLFVGFVAVITIAALFARFPQEMDGTRRSRIGQRMTDMEVLDRLLSETEQLPTAAHTDGHLAHLPPTIPAPASTVPAWAGLGAMATTVAGMTALALFTVWSTTTNPVPTVELAPSDTIAAPRPPQIVSVSPDGIDTFSI